MKSNKGMLYKYIYVTFVVALYWLVINISKFSSFIFLKLIKIFICNFFRVVSILMVFVNKTLLSSDKIHLNAPLFIIWCQCYVCVAICLILKFFSKLFPKHCSFPKGSSPFSSEIIKKVLNKKKFKFLQI